ncbi:hypothetical protein ACLK1T_16465 [Escherichia coli]
MKHLTEMVNSTKRAKQMQFMPFVPHIRWCWKLQSATPVQTKRRY